MTSVHAKQLPSYAGSSSQAAEDISGYIRAGVAVVVLAGDMRRAKLLAEFLNEHGVKCSLAEKLTALPKPGSCVITTGSLSAGLEYPNLRLAVLTDTQIAGSGFRPTRAARRRSARRAANSRTPSA